MPLRDGASGDAAGSAQLSRFGWQALVTLARDVGAPGTPGSMPLGIEVRSHACQRRIGRQRQSGGPVPPHPSPPPGEGALSVVVRDVWRLRFAATWPIVLPLLWGEGRGEGERSLRPFHSARSSEHDTLQTRFQFLAALDILFRSRRVRPPPSWPGWREGNLNRTRLLSPSLSSFRRPEERAKGSAIGPFGPVWVRPPV